MSATPSAAPQGLPDLGQLLAANETPACCAAVYSDPAVRWLLGDELHPGGAAGTRRALELAGVGAGDRLLDVGSGAGTSALLAAAEFGCEVVGLEYGAAAVREAQERALARGVGSHARFVDGDAHALPFADASFDAVLCECSLCTFTEKPRAVAEMHRVLRPGGSLALCDVVADHARLPRELRGPLATIACVGEALTEPDCGRLLHDAGFELVATESRSDDAAVAATRVIDRLRGARLLGLEGARTDLDGAIELARRGREAIADGALGYSIFIASRATPASPA